MFGHPGKKLQFMGSEFGQWNEWNVESSLDWHLLDDPLHQGLRRWVQDLNHTYQREASLHQVDFEPAGFSWVDCNDNENSVISMIRRARNPNDFTLMLANFTPVPRLGYRVGVPDGRLVSRAAEQRCRDVRREQYGQRRGRGHRGATSHGFDHSLTVNGAATGVCAAETKLDS
jgi:1,4-alpha-glucan branching enzyme